MCVCYVYVFFHYCVTIILGLKSPFSVTNL